MEQDGELVQRLFPSSARHGPFFSGVAQGQIGQLGCHIVTGEVSLVFDNFPQSHVQTLDGIGGVDDLADRFRIGKMEPQAPGFVAMTDRWV